MVEPDNYPCALIVHIPFPSHRLARAALRTLSVDPELSPLVKRSFVLVNSASNDSITAKSEHYDASVSQNVTSTRTSLSALLDESTHHPPTILKTEYRATTNRMLRVAVNGFFESLGTVMQVIEELDIDVLHKDGLESLQGAQGVE